MVEWKSDGKLPKSIQDQRSALRDKLARRHFRPEINARALGEGPRGLRYRIESEVEPPRASQPYSQLDPSRIVSRRGGTRGTRASKLKK